MAQFFDRYGSNDKCEAALIASRWPGGFACPACSASQNSVFRRQGRLYFQCSACRHQCSVISGTIFEASKLGLSRWFLAMHLLTQSKNNVAAFELMRHLGVCYKTAWLIKHKLMEVMREREDTRQLDGRVEIDDAYLGGELSGGKRGRGSQNKVPFIAAVDLTPFPGVLRRSDSNLYQFGLRVPRDLLSHFPNAWAVRRSLGTADLREANDKARSLQAEWAARFESLRTNKPMPLDVVALRAKLLAYVERFLLTADRRSIALTPTEREERARDIAWQLDRRPLSTPMVRRLHTQLGIPAESLIRPPKLPQGPTSAPAGWLHPAESLHHSASHC